MFFSVASVADKGEQQPKEKPSGFTIGQRVEARDGNATWKPGTVTNLNPLEVGGTLTPTLGLIQTPRSKCFLLFEVLRDVNTESFTWDEVRPIK